MSTGTKVKAVLYLLLLLAVAGVLTLFVLQNQQIVDAMALNLGFFAVELSGPQPLAVVVLASAGIGFLVGALLTSYWSWSRARAAKAAQASLAMDRYSSLGSSSSPSSSTSTSGARDATLGDDW